MSESDPGEYMPEESAPPRRRRPRDEDDDYERRFDADVRRRDLADDPAMRFLLPVGRSGWAIVSGYLGLVSILLFPAPFAVLTGILAIRAINRDPKKLGMGRAVFGIVMGSLGSIGLVVLLFGMMTSALFG